MIKTHSSNSLIATAKLNAVLILDDGSFFLGSGVGCSGVAFGEIAFNTSMTGYQEMMTDPSYSGQILTFTYPHIGNTGTNIDDLESTSPQVSGIVLGSSVGVDSNYRSSQTFLDFLKHHRLTGICEIDTRHVVQHIRRFGHLKSAIFYAEEHQALPIACMDEKYTVDPSFLQRIQSSQGLQGSDLTQTASNAVINNESVGLYDLDAGCYTNKPTCTHRVVILNYGIKKHILRSLIDCGMEPIVLPPDSGIETIMSHQPHGVFLSNGPGDPSATAEYALEVIKHLLKRSIPLFAICMGHQLLALASGMQTIKMKNGHRGANHPVQRLLDGSVEITSQNHGFCVSDETIPDNVQVTHRSLFDKTIEGIKRLDTPAFSVQFHPESSPGPHDSSYLFRDFLKLIISNQS